MQSKSSLRMRRPSDSFPSDRVAGPSGGKPKKLTKAHNDQQASLLGDKIKKRMSTRYADISGPRLMYRDAGDVPVPSMPQLRELDETPERHFEEQADRFADDYRQRGDDVVREDPRDLDMDRLKREDFNPEVCA